MTDLLDLQLLLNAHQPLILIDTFDETQALACLKNEGIRRQLPTYSWTLTEGLQSLDKRENPTQSDTRDPLNLLKEIKFILTSSLFVLCDFAVNSSLEIRLLREIAMQQTSGNHKLILISPKVTIPAILNKYTANIQLKWLNSRQVWHLINQEALKFHKTNSKLDINMSGKCYENLAEIANTIPKNDVVRYVQTAVWQSKVLCQEESTEINDARCYLSDHRNPIHFIHETYHSDALLNSKIWRGFIEHLIHAESTQQTVTCNDINEPPLNNLLICGLPKMGKHFIPCLIASQRHQPLIKITQGAFSETTKQPIKQLISHIEKLAPCTLWLENLAEPLTHSTQSSSVDAIGQQDIYTIGSNYYQNESVPDAHLKEFLAWLKRKNPAIFFVATCCDIDPLAESWLHDKVFSDLILHELPSFSERKALL